jgi:hypothetical protein
MGNDVIANGCFKAAGAAEDATTELLLGQEAKPALDEVEPRGASWGEVQMKAWALAQPALNSGSFMSPVVVEDQMDLELWRKLRLDLVKELAKLKGTVAPMKLADDLAGLSVQGGEERSSAVALVVRSPAFRLSRPHGQSWLRAIQRLNLRLFVNAQYQRPIRRSQIKPNYISYFIDEQRIPRKFEALAAVRGQAKARHTRCTLLRLRPQAAASERLLQCVAFFGVDSSVMVNTRSTSASLIFRGVPGRGSSNKPSSPLFRKRVRHLPIVCLVRRKCSATFVLLVPAAHSKMMRARCASAWLVFGRRAHCFSSSSSSSLKLSGCIGRPVRISFSFITDT